MKAKPELLAIVIVWRGQKARSVMDVIRTCSLGDLVWPCGAKGSPLGVEEEKKEVLNC